MGSKAGHSSPAFLRSAGRKQQDCVPRQAMLIRVVFGENSRYNFGTAEREK